MNEATGNEETEEAGGLVLNLQYTLAAVPEEVFIMLTESTELVKWWVRAVSSYPRRKSTSWLAAATASP